MAESTFVQLVIFKSKPDASDSDILAVAPLMKGDVLAIDGCQNWELFKSEDGRWIELIHWDSPEAAQRGNELMMTKASAQKAFAITDESSVDVAHLNRIVVDRK